eukprot:CAMPEP_0202900764 /NCGR_PEP_ID=MMETSP1392-20130828/12022_1 /ASSEMBLY_ACC=CAM_ASM_000868 /TAXON_ID=225041 /ORGANISM="Chlamydomonas chlamydogama, Strain SAG 11-48b" /LENGTH=76 /DNA_ID=CAMNT_0049587205 /DNA_START=53 /DNA_END=279 /DNA_ORIENTATION=-
MAEGSPTCNSVVQLCKALARKKPFKEICRFCATIVQPCTSLSSEGAWLFMAALTFIRGNMVLHGSPDLHQRAHGCS